MTITRRSRALEIMDGSAFTSAELSANLADLERYHRITGGYRVLVSTLRRMTSGLPRGSRLSILDVGAGSADLALRVSAWARRSGWRPRVVAVDLSHRILGAPQSSRGRPDSVRRCVADARALPLGDGAFDLAYSCLMMHHLDEESIAAALSEMRRVTRIGFVVSDLRRSPIALASVWALTRLTSRNRLTLHDGPLSVRRALTPLEARSLASRAGLTGKPASAGTIGVDGGHVGRGDRTGNGGRGGQDAGGAPVMIRREGAARLLLTFRHPGARPAS